MPPVFRMFELRTVSLSPQMPSQRVADAAHVVPYLTYGTQASHHGNPPDNAGRARQAKPKKGRQMPERSARSEDDMRFDTGPRPLRNLVANRGARRSARAGRRDRGYMHDGNEDVYPDYPPPTFLEAISTPPLSVCPSTTTLVTLSQPMVTSLPESSRLDLPTQSPSPSISSVLPQPSEPPSSPRRISDLDSDDSLEIIETDSVRAQIDNDQSRLGQEILDRYRAESPHSPGTPRGRSKSRKTDKVDSDSDENFEPPLATAKRKLSLSPLRTLFPYQSMVAQDRALSAHPSPNNSPYSSFPFLSTTSLKMSMSTSSFLKFPSTPTTTPRNESFLSRKLPSLKGKERARTESLDTWEVVESESPHRPTIDLLEDPATPTQGQNRGSPVSNTARCVLLELQPSGNGETDAFRNAAGTHPLSSRDRKAPPVPRISKTIQRSPPPPPVPPIPDSATTPTSKVPQPPLSSTHSRLANSSPMPKMKKPQVVCSSPLGANRWRAVDEVDDTLPFGFQRASATPLPSTPDELTDLRTINVLPATSTNTQTCQATLSASNKTSSPPLSPLTPLDGATTPPDLSDTSSHDRSFLPTASLVRRPSADSDVQSARHYPGRPLPRPPGPSRVLVDSTYAGYEDFQVSGNTIREGLLIDFNDTSLAESFTHSASTPQSDKRRYGSPLQISAAPSSSSASSMEFVEQEAPVPSQRNTTGGVPRATQSSVPGPFLEITDLDVLVSRLHDEQQNGSDHEVLLMLSDFIGPANPIRTTANSYSTSTRASTNDPGNKVNIPLLGDVEVERRRKTKDGRIKLKLVLLDSPVDKCGICLTQFRGNNAARLGSICRHAFHDKCLGRWLIRSKTCPMCRVPFADQN